MQKLAIALFALIALVAGVGLVITNNTSSAAVVAYPPYWVPYMDLEGNIYDKNGGPLWRSSAVGTWYNTLLAVAPDGTVIGSGAATSRTYRMTLDAWSGVVYVKIGHADYLDPYKSQFEDCGTLYLDGGQARYQFNRMKIYVDIVCDRWEAPYR